MTAGLRIDDGTVAEALQRVLRSRTFARSERLRAFLKFVVEMEQLGLAHQLKGYTIGIDVFSRHEGFDPGTDPLVRVQAGKLRKLLNHFYAEEGRDEPLRIRIPLGAYVPIYERAGGQRGMKAEEASAGGLQDLATLTRLALGKSGLVQGLPRVFIVPAPRTDERSFMFLNAIRLWEHSLWAVRLAPWNESPPATVERSDPLHFELAVTQQDCGTLGISLRHMQTGKELRHEQRSVETDADILKLGAAANEFAGANLTIPGRIYQFCHSHGLSTSAMLCLDATYRYSLDRSETAYLRARGYQQELLSLDNASGVIAETPHLRTLSSAHG